MPRDRKIRVAFEVADDGMQSVLGYFHYVTACKHIANQNIVIDYLPKGISEDPPAIHHVLKITYDWVRFYDPIDLVQSMDKVFASFHARMTLISLISIFEGCITTFEKRLIETGQIEKPKRFTYKDRLKWAINIVLRSTYGKEAMQNRIPDLCLNVDHGRRIRNLCMHNRGNYNTLYEKDIITIPTRKPIIEAEYYRYKKNKAQTVPFKLHQKLFDDIVLFADY